MRGARGLLVAALLSSVAICEDPKPAKDFTPQFGDVPFVVGMDAGREEAAFMGKPAMLFFTSTTDKASLTFAQRTWKNKDVLDRIAPYTPVLIDPDDEQHLFRRYHVGLIPAVVWLDFEDEPIIKSEGDTPLDEFVKVAETAKAQCPGTRPPGGLYEVVVDQKKKLDAAVAANDVKAEVAASAWILRIGHGAAAQAAAAAVDARLTKAGNDEIERAKGLVAKSRKSDAVKALEKLVADYGADHAVGKKAKEMLDALTPKPKPK